MKTQDLIDKFTEVKDLTKDIFTEDEDSKPLISRIIRICETVEMDWKIEQRQSSNFGTQLSKMADKIEFLHQDVEWLRVQAVNMRGVKDG